MFPKTQRIYHQCDPKIRQRIAEEAQLLAEERWIIETLKKIKAQRNGLQIERLHLESTRSKVLADNNKNQDEGKTNTKKKGEMQQPETTDVTATRSDLNDAPLLPDMDYNGLCNTEELNLSVTNSIFNTEQYATECDEEEDDEDDIDNCLLDMDMLMSEK